MAHLVNPLGLDVAWAQPGDLIPLHAIDRPADRNMIAASMTGGGWQGAPVVIDDRAVDGGYLVTGHHRRDAAIIAGLDSIPCVTLADLCEATGVDLDAYCDGSFDSEWEAVFGEIPAGARAAYGIDW